LSLEILTDLDQKNYKLASTSTKHIRSTTGKTKNKAHHFNDHFDDKSGLASYLSP